MATNDIYDVEVLKLLDQLMDRFSKAAERDGGKLKQFELTAQEVKMIKDLDVFYEVDKKGKGYFCGVSVKIVDKIQK